MESNILIDHLIETYIKSKLENDMKNHTKNYIHVNLYLEGFDCQDTEDNNETECYFYFRKDLASREDLEICRKELCSVLGLDRNTDFGEWDFDQEGNLARLELICSICHANGEKFQ